MTAHTEREGLRAHVRDLERQIARLRAENMAARDRALEEAAKECDAFDGPPSDSDWCNGQATAAQQIRAAIRALKGAKI